MADFCFQCNLDMCFGAYSDFDHYAKDHPDVKLIRVLCEGCGTVYVDREGKCVDSLCVLHTTERSREVLRRAEAWVARRTGSICDAYRLWDWWNGTPWNPGQKHFLRWRWLELIDKLKGRSNDPFADRGTHSYTVIAAPTSEVGPGDQDQGMADQEGHTPGSVDPRRPEVSE